MNEYVAKDLWEYEQEIQIEWLDFFGTIATALIFLFIGLIHQSEKLKRDPSYKFYFNGLAAKMVGSLFFCSIYVFYYNKGGDTIAYFESTMAMAKLFYSDPEKYFEVMISTPTVELRSLFTDQTGYPWSYLFYDSHTFMVIKLTSILTIITGGKFFLTSLLLGYFSYYAVWKLFLTFRGYFPEIEKKLAWAILYFPSPLFWAGGVSKDTYVYMAIGMFVYCAHKFFILKQRKPGSILLLLACLWLILNIKPYVLIVLLPGGLLWIFYNKLSSIKNRAITFILFPIILVVIMGLSYFVLSSLGDSMSKFSIDKALETAAVTSNDLKQDYYQGSSFDIGEFDGTISGVFKNMLPAIQAGLFRPFIWESRSVVLIMAGLENLFLLGFAIYILYETKIAGMFKIIFRDPLLLFCFTFTLFFAFMIGLTTSNFGALVRFKIPILPFFVSAMFIIDYQFKKENRLY